MPIDYTSLLLALGFAGGCLAVTLFATWFSSRSEGFILTWAIGTALIVAHVFVYGAFIAAPNVAVVVVAFFLLILGLALLFMAAVQFGNHPLSLGRNAIIVAASLIVALGAFATPYDGIGYILTNVVAAVLLFATAWQYGLAREEAPGAMLGLMLLYGLVGVSFLLCAAVLVVDRAWVLGMAPNNWAEELNVGISIGALAGVGALSLALNHARVARSHQRDAATDALTGLLNRRALFDMFSEQDLPPFTSVVAFDLDRFKAVNDGHGHAVGDEVLRRFADTLRTGVRGLDTAARLGGEEFAVVLPRSDAESALQVAERIRAAFAAVVVDGEHGPVRCTVSAGVATSGPQGERFAAVLRKADKALYGAKRAGRDRVVAEPLRLVG